MQWFGRVATQPHAASMPVVAAGRFVPPPHTLHVRPCVVGSLNFYTLRLVLQNLYKKSTQKATEYYIHSLPISFSKSTR